MKHKNYKDWHKQKEFENCLFFAQRLDELFFDYTLDTYKPAALNSAYLCREAIDLIKDIEDDVIDANNLVYVLEELEWSLSLDIVAKFIINVPSSKFIVYGETVKLSDTKIRLEVLEKILSPLKYINACEEIIKREVNGGSKKNINSVVKSYAAALINIGVSKQHMYETTNDFFFFGDEIADIKELDNFFYLISPTTHHFEIYFVVSNLINQIKSSVNPFDLKILDDLPAAPKLLAIEKGLVCNEEEVWVEIENITAFDCYAARKEAENRLDTVRDLFLLFSHKNRIKWKDDAIITQCCIETPVLIKKQKNSMEKCFDLKPHDASKRLNALIQKISLIDSSFIKFNRVVDLHGNGSTNDLPENQLLNIWIALETLVPSHTHGGGKVVKVSNALTPVLSINYIGRLIERFSADLIRWNRAVTSKILRKIPDSKSKSLYQKVLELIALESNKTLKNELYAEFDNFYLLRFRLYELSELFKNSDSLIQRIELHERKAKWQVRRIYRTRNLIVHSGRSLAYIDTLIENAHDYLDQAIQMIIEYSCGELQAESIEQAFEMALIDFDVYKSELKKITSFDSSNLKIILRN